MMMTPNRMRELISSLDPAAAEEALGTLLGVASGEPIPLREIQRPTRSEIRRVTAIIRKTFGQYAPAEENIRAYVDDVIYIAKLRDWTFEHMAERYLKHIIALEAVASGGVN
jgi:hypothetical protein